MVDQQAKFSLRGLKTEFVGEAQLNKEAEERVLRGEVQLVYISPESILSNFKFRRMLTSSVYMDNLVALVVDEAHCVKTWGDTFRYIFAEIGTLRSLISNHVKMMALTATCTSETLQIVKDRLSMNDPTIIALCPQRSNIFYNVKSAVSLDQLSSNVVEEFSKDRSMFIKTVIFCRTYKDCGDLFSTIRHKMGKNFTEPPEYPDFDEFRMVELYTRVSRPEKREAVNKLFAIPDGKLRLVIATTAFGMGVDCPDIRRIVHWGLPSNIEEYVQETGRAGRDGKDAEAVLYKGKIGHHANASMKMYASNTTYCRRKTLFQGFLEFNERNLGQIDQCKCCDICANSCKCSKCSA